MRLAARTSLEPAYFTVILSAWCFTPFLRRFIDWQNGAFSSVELISVLPLILMLPLAWLAIRKERLRRVPRALVVCACIWCGTFLYALAVGYIYGNGRAALFEFAQYQFPMLAGLWLAGQDAASGISVRHFSTTLAVLAGIVALYGIYQCFAAPPWDTLWIQSADMLSIRSEPPLRVFSTLNSVTPCADFLMAALLISYSGLLRLGFFNWVITFATVSALIATMDRSAWIALVVGAIALVLLKPGRAASLSMIAFTAGVVVLWMSPLTLLDATQYGSFVANRAASLTDIGHDDSALTRQGEIQDLLNDALNNPLGAGLGTVGAAAKISQGPATSESGTAQSPSTGNPVDSGYIARFLELGYAGFLGYLVVIAATLLLMLSAALHNRTGGDVTCDLAALGFAFSAALVWLDASVDAHVGIEGLLFWILLGVTVRKQSEREPESTFDRAPPGTFGRPKQVVGTVR